MLGTVEFSLESALEAGLGVFRIGCASLLKVALVAEIVGSDESGTTKDVSVGL